MDSEIPVNVKVEPPEVDVDHPDEGSMKSHSLLPSNNIKLEPACEADDFGSSTREMICKAKVFEKKDCEIPASVKIEPPEVYVDYPGEEIHPSPPSFISPQGQSQMEKKMVFGNMDRNLMKHGLSDALCEDKSHRFSEVAGNSKTESRMSEDSTLLHHHKEVLLSKAENCYTASQQYENCSHLSESVSSMIEVKTKIGLTNENCQLHNVETPVKHTQNSRTSLDNTVGYPSCSSERIQAGDTPHMADACDVTNSADTLLHRHKKKDTEQKPYKCDVCGACFPQPSNLNCHVRTHTGEKPFKCDVCAAFFNQAGHLKRHMRIHTGEKPYKCDICGRSFIQSGNLKYHMRTHTVGIPFKCFVCGESFTEVDKLKSHKKIHAGENPYKCDVCGASFPQASNLNCHVRTHTGEKPFKCDICAASFAQAGNLKCHMRTHTGEKPYKCDICAASFTVTNKLKRHMRTHTGEKPYKCDICAVSFADSGHLKCHMRTHTGEKPYKCDICAVSFAKAGNLKSHVRTHTRVKRNLKP